MIEQRNGRMPRQTEAETRCCTATAASPALYLMRLFFIFCINLESINPVSSSAQVFSFSFFLSAAVFFPFISIILKQWLPCQHISTPVPTSDLLRECFHPLPGCIPRVCYCLVFRRFIETEIGALFGKRHHSYLPARTDICFIWGGWFNIYAPAPFHT